LTLGRRRLAVAASARFPDLGPDWPLLRQALTTLGIAASTEVWTDPAVRWDAFDLVVANGAWDNIHQPAEFLEWAEHTARLAPMVNSPATLRWNLDKHYLAVLAAAGVTTVPTTWLSATAPGETGARPRPRAEAEAEAEVPLPPGELVVKPTISGGGFQTARYRAGVRADAWAHVHHLLDAGRDVMVQPYQAAVDSDGEGDLIFLGGQFSHAIRKGPVLRPDAGPRPHLWDLHEITALDPTPAQLQCARTALSAAEQLLGPTTYARVDLVPLADGTPALLELEILDPALFLEYQPAAADRFAAVLERLLP
jgi:O-ureido-D-serine cyclo-ligase